MSKSKKAPALFEVIGNSSFQPESTMKNGIGSPLKNLAPAAKRLAAKAKQPAFPPPARTASVLKSASESASRAPIRPLTPNPETLFQVDKGRVFFSLNMNNLAIAGGVLVLAIIAAFLIGYRAGPTPDDGTIRIAAAPPAENNAAQAGITPGAFSNPGSSSAKKKTLPLASASKKTSPKASGKPKTVKFTKRGSSNTSAVVQKSPPQPAVDTSSLGTVETTDPRTPNTTYIVIESFYKKAGHDGLKHARHAQAFMATQGIPTYIIPKKSGKIGWQLISRKGFSYQTQKRACLDYKQKIRELAKKYKPLPGGYGLYQGFPEKFIPTK